MPVDTYQLLSELTELHKKGRLLAAHFQNLHWVPAHEPRPPFLHCLPIGTANMVPTGRAPPKVLLSAIERNVVSGRAVGTRLPSSDISSPLNSPGRLLLVAFLVESNKPDRKDALSQLPKEWATHPNPNIRIGPVTLMTRDVWFDTIAQHKFVLCPHGHGYDTHRMTEVLLMGSIPVIRRSTITSCYDDEDNDISVLVNATTNEYRNVSRGSLPVVIVDRWQDVTVQLLQDYWAKVVANSLSPNYVPWDFGRLTADHYRERITGRPDPRLQSGNVSQVESFLRGLQGDGFSLSEPLPAPRVNSSVSDQKMKMKPKAKTQAQPKGKGKGKARPLNASFLFHNKGQKEVA
jgi:hypothetical protein